ncbi:MAG: respiratory nitrate reductase subunit gamma [Gammaproteobacteria bacterium]|nr:respiratory nitrate reductase subunit gamma [Gammaproteobacteria bacterium]
MTDIILLVVFPYLAVVLGVGAGVYRYRHDRFSYSSLSSQLLENRQLFWGSIPWHYGITIVLLAHLVAFLVPRAWSRIIADPVTLYTLEVAGFVLALTALVGLLVLSVRRLSQPRIRAVSTVMDWVLLAVLLLQVALGFWVSLAYRWGADWYVHTAVPWLYSLLTLQPDTQYVASLPWVVKLHMINGFLVIALFPFTRLVHLIALPFWYLWRPYQVVIRNRST